MHEFQPFNSLSSLLLDASSFYSGIWIPRLWSLSVRSTLLTVQLFLLIGVSEATTAQRRGLDLALRHQQHHFCFRRRLELYCASTLAREVGLSRFSMHQRKTKRA